jgi:ADP-ribose diphosphatase
VERVVDSQVLHRGRYLTFRVDTIERADGSRSERDIADHPGAVAIVAIDPDDRVLLVRQWRTPAGRVLLEIPAGTLDVVDETTGRIEDPDLAAARELEEETGYRAAGWQRLTAFWSAPGFTSELMHLYLATGLTAADPDERLGPDEGEHLRLERRPFAEALAAVERGEIVDSKSIVGLLWVDRLRRPASVATAAGEAAAAGRTGDLDPGGGGAAANAAAGGLEQSYRLTMTEAILSAAWTLRNSRAFQVVGLIFAAAAAIQFSSGDGMAAAISAIFAGLLWSGAYCAPFILVGVWRYRERILPQIAVAIGPHGITYRSAHASSTMDWASITRLRETGRFVFISFPPTTYLFPTRVFTPLELARVRRWSAEAGFGPDGRRA